mmetsp:Transcript_6695/g.14807  ORF Transcript_6695/g.14807 Transcript_6695/m.14807 type:complete len:197 (-) Transcript_6695:48-638(-)
MKCIFCCHSHCQVNIHYRFLRNVERELSKSPSNSASNIRFQLYSKYIDRVHGTLSKYDRRPIPLCVTELIRSLSPDKNGRYRGFRYADGTTIDQLEECQLKEGEEVFHIQVFISAIDVENFIERSPVMVAWETRDSKDKPQLKKLDICFDNLNPFLDTMRYCYDNFSAIKWIVTNKIMFQCNKSDAKSTDDSKNDC